MYSPAPQPHLPQPLMKNKLFIAFLTLGLACAAAWLVMTIYFLSNTAQCLDDFYCLNQLYNYHTCMIGDMIYCCGSGGGSYRCGSYDTCYYEGSFSNCTGRWAALWVVGMASLSFLVGMMIVAWGHRRRQQRQYLMQ